MRSSRLASICIVAGVAAGSLVIACGGGGGGGPKLIDGPSKTPDAKVFMDAAAGSGVKGEGQACSMTAPCPTGMDCIALGKAGGASTTSYCTPHCDDNATATTNGSGVFAGGSAFTPPPNNNCATMYTATPGMGACGVILSTTPADNPLKPNTTYTKISLGCVVVCGTGNVCPTGMAADTADFGACLCFPM